MEDYARVYAFQKCLHVSHSKLIIVRKALLPYIYRPQQEPHKGSWPASENYLVPIFQTGLCSCIPVLSVPAGLSTLDQLDIIPLPGLLSIILLLIASNN